MAGAEYMLLPASGSEKLRLNRRSIRGWGSKWLIVSVAAVLFFGGASLLGPQTRSPPPAVFLPSPDSSGRLLPVQTIHESLFDKLFPIGEPERADIYQDANNVAMRTLLRCASTSNCHQNQTSVVLLASPHFAGSIEGRVSGEDIWAASIIAGLQEMGYTFLYSKNNEELAVQYRQFPDLVKVVILECEAARKCFRSPTCIRSADNPLGIPVWKLLSFHFWTGQCHPLGAAWTLSPENFANWTTNSADNFYLGYSVERTCTKLPVVPFSQREDRAYVFGKRLSYFTDAKYAWPGVTFPKAVAGVAESPGDTIPGTGIKNLGILDKHTFYSEVARSKVLVGVAQPDLSPSPYDALCLGVPFINPVTRWDEEYPDDRSKWAAQHDGLLWQEEPYVYHVRSGDKAGLMAALERAYRNPIDRYIPPAMTMESLKMRLAKLIHTDWKSRAEGVLEQRLATGHGDLFTL